VDTSLLPPFFRDGNIIDGHHRVRACEELGITDWPRMVRDYADEAAKRTLARKLNLAGRHMDQAAKRALIEAEAVDHPEKSNRQIATDLGVSHPTVAAVRADLAGRGKIDHVSTRTDTISREETARMAVAGLREFYGSTSKGE
jgi:ParB-like chromosome segregation protein Spo0J